MHTEILAIEQAKYRYVRAGDTHDWELLRSVVTDDFEGVWDAGFSVSGAEEFMSLSRRIGDERRLVVHTLSQPEIAVNGNFATGIWVLNYRALRRQTGTLVEGAGHYFDEYQRASDGQWRIARVRLQRLYEFETSLADLRSFHVNADHPHPVTGFTSRRSHDHAREWRDHRPSRTDGSPRRQSRRGLRRGS